jgi:hypothetical protein
VQPRYDNFIGGKWIAPVEGRFRVNLSPATARPICEVADSTPQDIELALDAAHAAKDAWGERSSTGSATCRSSKRRGASSQRSSDSSSRPSRPSSTPDNGAVPARPRRGLDGADTRAGNYSLLSLITHRATVIGLVDAPLRPPTPDDLVDDPRHRRERDSGPGRRHPQRPGRQSTVSGPIGTGTFCLRHGA